MQAWWCALILLGSLVISAAGAEPPAGKDAEAIVPLMDGLGDLEHQITTDKPLAQQYFNQGMRLLFAFNHDEAIRAFRAAEKIDTDCAMAQWGIALALGPNYNLGAEPERSEAAFKALGKAQELAPRATPREQAYIAALATRYSADPKADRKQVDRDYADAMNDLATRFPDDLDAAVLAAEAMMQLRPWDLWSADGTAPLPGTEEIVARLEGVLAKNPNHPGANHYYIHAVEASDRPQRALGCARRLGDLMPAAGHLVHMPSHIYFRLGMYEDAVNSNRQAVAADETYIEKSKPMGIYPMMYYPHNIHFLWAALSMEGRSAESIAAASKVAQKLRLEMAEDMPMVEYFVPVPWYALVRFEKWDEVFEIAQPPSEFTYASGMWHYARGKALAGKGKLQDAKEELAALGRNLAATPQDFLLMRHSAVRLLGIATSDLSAAVASAGGDQQTAIAQLRLAVILQDNLLYDEPPPWYFSEREALGKALLAAGNPAEAEAVFNDDLKRHPVNGWALFGLEKSLRAQNRTAEADDVHNRFEKAWARADIKPR
jgi:tetratricopeptide (TPR) repeat protein